MSRLHRIRYRDSFQVREAFVDAAPERARAVAEAWCLREGGYRLVSVDLAVVADESILSPAKAVQPIPAKVSA